MYAVIRSLLFLLPPETAHHFTFGMLKFLMRIPFLRKAIEASMVIKNKRLEKKIAGILFRNPVGLAAGLDKDAKYFDELGALGFGFVEIGTVTPLPQPGNDQPRLFRLKRDQALINRMGFNNEGALAAAARLKKRRSDIVIGGNIGKNKSTPNEKAMSDYISCFHALFKVVDYFVVNVSSPNTPGLRELQGREQLTQLLQGIQNINLAKAKPKPVFLKIAPDLTPSQLDEIIAIVNESKIAGIVATNTTISRENLEIPSTELEKIGNGGLSGKPLRERSTEVIRYIAEKSNKAFFIMGVGGIHSPQDAIEKLQAGADLVQLYTGFIYEGPSLIKNINREILKNSSPS